MVDAHAACDDPGAATRDPHERSPVGLPDEQRAGRLDGNRERVHEQPIARHVDADTPEARRPAGEHRGDPPGARAREAKGCAEDALALAGGLDPQRRRPARDDDRRGRRPESDPPRAAHDRCPREGQGANGRRRRRDGCRQGDGEHDERGEATHDQGLLRERATFLFYGETALLCQAGTRRQALPVQHLERMWQARVDRGLASGIARRGARGQADSAR